MRGEVQRRAIAVADLRSVDDALGVVLNSVTPLSSETIPLYGALNRVLAEDIIANENLPPFANSSMDGYAVRAADTTGANTEHPIRLSVIMDIPAGSAPTDTLLNGQAARIMTGAPVPDGADAIIPVENTDGTWSGENNTPLATHVKIYAAAKLGDNIRLVGENVAVGQRVLSSGRVLQPQDLGILAALGQAAIPVIRQPHVAILSSGDELVGVDQPLTPGKIRDVNSYTLAGLVHTAGGIPIVLPTAHDTLDDIRALFHNALEQQPDLIVSSAGVSVGAADLIRAVLAELGEVNFWRINLRPGKPLAYGHLRKIPFFGLPGNPVSAMVTFEVFVRPVLLRMAGRTHDPKIISAVIDKPIRSDGRRSYVRVTLSEEHGQWIARETGTQSSGALMSMVLADGLLVIPENLGEVPAGTALNVYLLR